MIAMAALQIKNESACSVSEMKFKPCGEHVDIALVEVYCSARASYVEIAQSEEALELRTNSKLLVEHIPHTDPKFRHEFISRAARRSAGSRRI